MSQRSKNLLEAFNQSKAPEKSPEPVAPPKGSAPKAGGPFADAAPVARPAREAPAPEPRSAAPVAEVPREQRWRVVALCAVVALTFFFVGRASVGGVQASAGGDEAAVAPGTPPAVQAPAPARSGIDALRDRANLSTILACTYDLTADGEKSAMLARARLVELGLPAEVYQYPAKKQIFLLVGAAPRHGDLEKQLGQVQSATSQRGKKDFTSALIVQIDSVIASPDRR